jgi:hypothetical protein
MARRKAPRVEPVRLPADLPVPAELLDPDAPQWWDFDAYRGYMAERGWPMQARDRLRVVDPELAGAGRPSVCAVAAEGRRLRAAQSWAARHGLDRDTVRALVRGREAA